MCWEKKAVSCSNEHQPSSQNQGLSAMSARMADSHLTKLRRARTRVHWQLHKLDPMVAGYQAKRADIEAKIAAIASDFLFPPRRYQPNPFFKRGELPRVVLDIMREAGGPIGVKAITVAALALKGGTLPDPKMLRRTRIKVFHTLARWQARDLVTSVGRGKATRRALVVGSGCA